METADLRCIFCNSETLEISEDSLSCTDCKFEFPKYKDVYFLGAYGAADTLGLIEVTSKLSSTMNVSEQRAKWDDAETRLAERFEDWKASGYEVQATNEAFGSNSQAANIRLREWGAFDMLADTTDFRGKKVLDVGAGLGADAIRLANRGSDLTCIDFNPTSVHIGKQIVPEARWMAATSDCLPFKSDSFDFAIANAAMHHMHDFRKTFDEMLRVTRPGGYIMMISDPFMEKQGGEGYREQVELKVFARHPMVLGGVNEGILPIDEYFDCLSKCEDVSVLTMRIHNSPEYGEKPKHWSFTKETLDALSDLRGNINSKMKVPTLDIKTETTSEFIPAKELFATIGSPSESWNLLTNYLDLEAFDRFPFAEITKFDLMNGWLPNSDASQGWINGYNRMRLFLSEEHLNAIEGFQIRRHDNGHDHFAQVKISINSQDIKDQPVSPNHAMSVTVSEFADKITPRNVIEIAIKDGTENKGAVWGTFNNNRVLSVSQF